MKSVYSTNSYSPQSGSRFANAPVTKWLLITLLVFYLFDTTGTGESLRRLMHHLALDSGAFHEVWRWFTYPLVDWNLGGWLFGMITFFVFGRMVEQGVGSRRYGMLLLYSTLTAAAVYALVGMQSTAPALTGSSGLSLTIIAALALLYPEQKIQLLIPPIPLKLKTLAMGLITVMVVMSIAQQINPAESLSHLSGVSVAFLCMKNLHWLDLGKKAKKRRAPNKKVKRRRDSNKKVKKGMRARTVLNMSESKHEAEVNRILDKVSAEGIGNLTEDEREVLKFASKND